MSRDTLRLLVTTAFAFCALVLYQQWDRHTRPVQESVRQPVAATPEQASPAPAAGGAPADIVPEVTQDLEVGSNDLPPGASTGGTEVPTTLPQSKVPVHWIENESVRMGFDARGDIVRLDLLRHLVELDSDPLALFFEGDTRKFLPQTGMLGDGLPSHLDDGWRARPVAEGSRQVTSVWSDSQVTVTRTVTLAESGYIVDYDYRVENGSGEPVVAHAYFQFLRDSLEPIDYSGQVPSFYGAAIYTDAEKYAKHDFDEFENYPKRASDGWIAIVQRYFMAAWLDSGEARENYMRNLDGGDVIVGVIRSLGNVPPGSSAEIGQTMYAGALEQEQLESIAPAEGQDIKLAVDYGLLTLLAAPLFTLLEFIHNLVGNWGIAIIFLTVLIKLAFFPLSAKSYRSMARMKNVAPQMQKLKERFGDDRQGMQKAVLELYRKEKINPLGGCLPILIQIPVFIALYWMLLEAVELRQANFGGWIRDLANPDPFFILPVLLGLAMFGQFKLNPTPPDPTQAMIMKIMPIGFAAFSIIMPSGLVLYWVTNTVLSIAQQWQITRTIGAQAKQRR